jgi:hypothetical protein
MTKKSEQEWEDFGNVLNEKVPNRIYRRKNIELNDKLQDLKYTEQTEAIGNTEVFFKNYSLAFVEMWDIR